MEGNWNSRRRITVSSAQILRASAPRPVWRALERQILRDRRLDISALLLRPSAAKCYRRTRPNFFLSFGPYPEKLNGDVTTYEESFHPQNSLDVGCGAGFLVNHFRGKKIQAFGVDGSKYALSIAPQSVRDYLMRVDLENERLPFDDESFDLVTSIEVLEHLQAKKVGGLLNEIERVCKKSGILFVTTPTKYFDSRFAHILQGRGPFVNQDHVNVQNRGYWVRQFTLHGFRYLRVPTPPKEIHREMIGKSVYKLTSLLANLPAGALAIHARYAGWYLFQKRVH